MELGSEIEDILVGEISLDHLLKRELDSICSKSIKTLLSTDECELLLSAVGEDGNIPFEINSNAVANGQFIRRVLITAYHRFIIGNDFETGHSLLKGLSVWTEINASDTIKDIVYFELQRALAFGYMRRFKHAEALNSVNNAINNCPRIDDAFANGMSDTLVLATECYSSLGKREDALQSARLAVNLAHERLENQRELLMHEGLVLDPPTSLILAYCTLSSELEKSGMGQMSLEWYSRALQVATQFELAKEIRAELQKLIDFSEALMPQAESSAPKSSSNNNSNRLRFAQQQRERQESPPPTTTAAAPMLPNKLRTEVTGVELFDVDWANANNSGREEAAQQVAPPRSPFPTDHWAERARPRSALPRLAKDNGDGGSVEQMITEPTATRRPLLDVDSDGMLRPKSALSKLGGQYQYTNGGGNGGYTPNLMQQQQQQRPPPQVYVPVEAFSNQAMSQQQAQSNVNSARNNSYSNHITPRQQRSREDVGTQVTPAHSIILLPLSNAIGRSGAGGLHRPMSAAALNSGATARAAAKIVAEVQQEMERERALREGNVDTQEVEESTVPRKSASSKPKLLASRSEKNLSEGTNNNRLPVNKKVNKTALSKTLHQPPVSVIPKQPMEQTLQVSASAPVFTQTHAKTIPQHHLPRRNPLLDLDEEGKESMKKVASAHMPFFKGLKVEARYQKKRLGAKGGWYLGRIINADFLTATYEIEFENGDREADIFVDDIRIPEVLSRKALHPPHKPVLQTANAALLEKQALEGKEQVIVPARLMRKQNQDNMKSFMLKMLAGTSQRADQRKIERISIKNTASSKMQAIVRGVLMRLSFPRVRAMMIKEKELRNKAKEIASLEQELKRRLDEAPAPVVTLPSNEAVAKVKEVAQMTTSGMQTESPPSSKTISPTAAAASTAAANAAAAQAAAAATQVSTEQITAKIDQLRKELEQAIKRTLQQQKDIATNATLQQNEQQAAQVEAARQQEEGRLRLQLDQQIQLEERIRQEVNKSILQATQEQTKRIEQAMSPAPLLPTAFIPLPSSPPPRLSRTFTNPIVQPLLAVDGGGSLLSLSQGHSLHDQEKEKEREKERELQKARVKERDEEREIEKQRILHLQEQQAQQQVQQQQQSQTFMQEMLATIQQGLHKLQTEKQQQMSAEQTRIQTLQDELLQMRTAMIGQQDELLHRLQDTEKDKRMELEQHMAAMMEQQAQAQQQMLQQQFVVIADVLSNIAQQQQQHQSAEHPQQQQQQMPLQNVSHELSGHLDSVRLDDFWVSMSSADLPWMNKTSPLAFNDTMQSNNISNQLALEGEGGDGFINLSQFMESQEEIHDDHDIDNDDKQMQDKDSLSKPSFYYDGDEVPPHLDRYMSHPSFKVDADDLSSIAILTPPLQLAAAVDDRMEIEAFTQSLVEDIVLQATNNAALFFDHLQHHDDNPTPHTPPLVIEEPTSEFYGEKSTKEVLSPDNPDRPDQPPSQALSMGIRDVDTIDEPQELDAYPTMPKRLVNASAKVSLEDDLPDHNMDEQSQLFTANDNQISGALPYSPQSSVAEMEMQEHLVDLLKRPFDAESGNLDTDQRIEQSLTAEEVKMLTAEDEHLSQGESINNAEFSEHASIVLDDAAVESSQNNVTFKPELSVIIRSPLTEDNFGTPIRSQQGSHVLDDQQNDQDGGEEDDRIQRSMSSIRTPTYRPSNGRLSIAAPSPSSKMLRDIHQETTNTSAVQGKGDNSHHTRIQEMLDLLTSLPQLVPFAVTVAHSDAITCKFLINDKAISSKETLQIKSTNTIREIYLAYCQRGEGVARFKANIELHRKRTEGLSSPLPPFKIALDSASIQELMDLRTWKLHGPTDDEEEEDDVDEEGASRKDNKAKAHITDTILDPNHCLIRCSSIRFDTVISTVLQLAEAYLHWTMQSLVINAALTQLFAEITINLREGKDNELKDQESLDSASLQWVEDLVDFLQTGRTLFVHSIHKLQGLEDRVAAVIQDFEFDNRRLREGEDTESDHKDDVLLLESQGDSARGDKSKSHSLDETAELVLSGKLQAVTQSVYVFFAKRTVNHQLNGVEDVENEYVPDFIALAQQQYDAWGNGFTKCLLDFVHALHVTEILVREPNVVQTVTTCIKMAVEMAAKLLDKVNWKAFWTAREELTSILGKKKVANLITHAEKLMFASLYDKGEGDGGKSRMSSIVSLADQQTVADLMDPQEMIDLVYSYALLG